MVRFMVIEVCIYSLPLVANIPKTSPLTVEGLIYYPSTGWMGVIKRIVDLAYLNCCYKKYHSLHFNRVGLFFFFFFFYSSLQKEVKQLAPTVQVT